MYKKIVFAIGVYLTALGLNAQNPGVNEVLRQIGKNNKKLQAYSAWIESKHLDRKTENNLSDPQTDVYYLPWGNDGAYTELQISQSVEFPTVYGARGNLIGKQRQKMQLEYEALRQGILLKAKKHLLEIIYLDKRLAVTQKRTRQAKRVFNHIQELYEQEEVGKLEMNKAKVAWMQQQFKAEQLQNQKQNELVLLKELNGGKAVSFNPSGYDQSRVLAKLDSLWKSKQARDPALAVLQQQEEVARQQVRLSKNKALPDLKAGFNYQNAQGSSFSGIYGGISIPLWNNKNKVKTAKARLEYQQTHSEATRTQTFARYQKKYNEYRMLREKYQKYRSTLSGLQSDTLLLEAYRLGDITFIEYHMELKFYRQAYDAMLEVKNQLNKRKAELRRHQL
ncbi:MAG: TolC family protein [Bacteroidales bacterium]|nr:TolC family protein [Bacteroidales bacterium]